MAFLYHYHAFTQRSVGVVTYADGVLTVPKPIAPDEYLDIRRRIAGANGWDESATVVASLSLLSCPPNGQRALYLLRRVHEEVMRCDGGIYDEIACLNVVEEMTRPYKDAEKPDGA